MPGEDDNFPAGNISKDVLIHIPDNVDSDSSFHVAYFNTKNNKWESYEGRHTLFSKSEIKHWSEIKPPKVRSKKQCSIST